MRQIQLTSAEYAEAQAVFVAPTVTPVKQSPHATVFGWIIFISLAIMLIVLIRRDQSHSVGSLIANRSFQEKLAWAMIVSGFIGFMFIWFFVFRRLRLSQERHTLTISFDEQGITWLSPGLTTRWNWSAFTEFRQTQLLMLFFTEPLQVQMIPKRAFEDSQELSSFLALANTKVASPGEEKS